MTGTLRLLATGIFVAAAAPAHAQAAPPPSGSGAEWRSMAGAKVAVPLPPAGPMASDLEVKAAPPRWADVPLPPPPAGMKPAPAPAAPAPAAAAPGTAAAAAAAGAAAEGLVAAPAGGAPSGAAPVVEKAPAAQEEPPATTSAAGATAAGLAAVAAATPTAEPGATPPAGGGPGPAKVTTAVDRTGAMISVQQDLESDKIRMAWAQAGGTLPAFEGNLGLLFMFKDMSTEAGAGAYMNGIGFSAGLKIALLTLDPPNYEKRDRSWTAWKLGIGGDMGVTSVTIYNPNVPAAYQSMSASMTSQTLIMNLGFMHAIGSFDGPHDWSGFAIGLDWAPSSQKTTTTVNVAGAKPQTSTAFNPRGFAINFESGSMASMASKMGKKAKVKLSIFILPPVGDLPLLMNTTIGAVWY